MAFPHLLHLDREPMLRPGDWLPANHPAHVSDLLHGDLSCDLLDDDTEKLAVRCSVHGALAVVFGLARARRVRCQWCAAEGRG